MRGTRCANQNPHIRSLLPPNLRLKSLKRALLDTDDSQKMPNVKAPLHIVSERLFLYYRYSVYSCASPRYGFRLARSDQSRPRYATPSVPYRSKMKQHSIKTKARFVDSVTLKPRLFYIHTSEMWKFD